MGKDHACAVRSCCAEGRAIAIFEALGGLDRQFIKERSVTDSRILAAVKNNTKGPTSNSVGPGGTGYGTGGGCGTSHMPTLTTARRGKRKLMNNSTTTVTDVAIPDWDKTLVAGLATLTALLPEPYAENAQVYDILPHPSIGHLISLSQ